MGGSGHCPDEKDLKITALETQLVNLQVENDTLMGKVNELTEQVGRLTLEPSLEEQEPAGTVSDEALRKRLMRICSRKADGILDLEFWECCFHSELFCFRY